MENEMILKIEPVKELDDLSSIQPIFLNCILMENNEIMFCGRSLGFLKEEEIKKHTYIQKGE